MSPEYPLNAKVLAALTARGVVPEIFPSSNFNQRPAGEPVSAAVIHFTALDFEPSVHHLTRKETGVSTHFLIDRNGALSQLVPVDLRSWHAGVGCLYDSRDVNGISVGIDLVFVPNGNSRYEEAQYRSLALLLAALREVLPIRPERIVGHEHVALPPGRKNDPGPTFNWKRVFRDQQLEIPPDWCQWERS